jgi:hypothetical protein
MGLALAMMACPTPSSGPRDGTTTVPSDGDPVTVDTTIIETGPTDSKGELTPGDTLQPGDVSDVEGEASETEPVNDSNVPDTADTTEVTGVPNIVITSPVEKKTFEAGTPIKWSVLATDTHYGTKELIVTWSSETLGELASATPDDAGFTETIFSIAESGWHEVIVTVTNPDGKQAHQTRVIGICQPDPVESFAKNDPLSDWVFVGASTHNPGGWIDMTGIQQSQIGAVYRKTGKVPAGDLMMGFKFYMGGGLNEGGLGSAVSIINVPSPFEMDSVMTWLGVAGCLGYGVSGFCGPFNLDAFHVEFDTWPHKGSPVQDPTDDHHVSVMLNGNAANHVFWYATPQINDGNWHDVVIQIKDNHISVILDDVSIIDGILPAYQFNGGYIVFSGTTDWATNEHRFDDFWVDSPCSLPP